MSSVTRVTRPHTKQVSASPTAAAVVLAPIAAYQRLATRVIHRAYLDLDSGSLDDRETARTFLAGSPMLMFWCQLAQLNAGNVMARTAVKWVEATPDAETA